MSIKVDQLSHRFGDDEILRQINLSIGEGEVVCILGPSGSGKSTLLRLIAGLEALQCGELKIGDKTISKDADVPTEKRRVGLVFQDHVLFPHMTVAENVAFGLAGNNEQLVDSLLESVELTDFRNRYPHTLSGGQQQRVALIRALANQPIAMLLDEPFANVDVGLRTALRDDALNALRASGTATVLVTHDPEEAMLMADRIACLVDGEIVQTGTPEELWSGPRHPFVAQTIAGAQVVDGVAVAGQIETVFGSLRVSSQISGDVKVCINKRDLKLVDGDRAEVRDIRFVDGANIVSVRAGQQSLSVLSDKPLEFSPGDSVNLLFAADSTQVYPA